MAIRCCIYCRVSSDINGDAKKPMDRQRDTLREAAEKLGFEVTHEVLAVEEAISANRRGIQSLIHEAREGNIDCILIDDLSRLSRHMEVVEDIARQFEQHGLKVFTPSGEAKLNEVLSPPLGYKINDGIIEVDELNSEVVKWVFDTTEEYTNDPPSCLVEDVIAHHKEFYDEDLSYEEAKEKVSYSSILNYATAELRMKICLYDYGDDESVEALQEILALSYEEAREEYDAIPKDVRPKTSRYSAAVEDLDVVNMDHDSIVSEEVYEAVQAKLKENQGPVL